MEGIAETVEEWFAGTATTTEGSVLETLRESALTAARPDATLDIARDLADMVIARREELKKKGGAKDHSTLSETVEYGMGPPELQ